ncbi:hypothetical protein ABEB36_001881 [Hypothenemus hampei]|uniref:Ig-like domain-containing protein n=1 Tax=Hypothenemus hampei TaxID=57062 RepID=A0ABD1FJK3_HYPHA
MNPSENLLKKKDGDQLFSPDEDFTALMGDDEDTVAFVFQHVNSEESTLTSVARTTRGLLSFGAVVTGEISAEGHQSGHTQQTQRKPFRHWKPSLIVDKNRIECHEGDQAMLQVQINGYPKPDIRCTFNELPIKPSSKYKIYHENHEHILLLVIKDVHQEDAGTYTVMAENEIGFHSVDIQLDVVRQKYPSIKSKIEDLSIACQETLVIPAEVDGIPKPQVQFLKEGREISPQTNPHILIEENYPFYTLTINETSLTDTGVYSIVATNSLAQASQFWGIYVYSKPKFLEKLPDKDLQVAQEDIVLLRVKVQGEPRPVIKWFRDHIQLVASRTTQIDDDDGYNFLKLRSIGIKDAGLYKCRAENSHGYIEDQVRVDVKKAPIILEAFEDALVLEQDVFHIIHTVEFIVRLEAFPLPEVQWFLDGYEIPKENPLISMAQTKDLVKLVINEPTTDLSGEYLCRMTNECGQAETSANLTVNCSPRVMVHLRDQTIKENDVLSMAVIVRGFPAPQFKWYRSNQELEPGETVQMGLETFGKKKFKIFCRIEQISYAQRGDYEVETFNNWGNTKSKCFVNVLTKPVVLDAQMKDLVVKEGAHVTYSIHAFGNPLPEVTWLWENTSINPNEKKDRNKLITSSDGTEFRLGIRNVKFVDAGVYQCVLENRVGVTKHRAALAVLRRKAEDEHD